MAGIQSHSTTVQGLPARYYTAGNGTSTVVLLHGGGADSALLSWRLAIPELAQHSTVIAPDWPGYGGSQIFPEAYQFERMISWLTALLNDLGVRRASFAGISMGGGAAICMALTHPERVERLALVDSYGLARTFSYHRLSYWMIRNFWIMEWSWALVRRSRKLSRMSLAQIFADPRNITPELEEETYQAVLDPSGQRAFGKFQQAEMLPDRLRTCFMDRLGEIHAPTLIIHGAKDRLVPLTASQEAARRIPNARLEVIQNAGHWPMREQPQQFNHLLVDFFKPDE